MMKSFYEEIVLDSGVYLFSMATAVSSATFIMVVKEFWRCSEVVSSPVRMWSEMVQMHSAR